MKLSKKLIISSGKFLGNLINFKLPGNYIFIFSHYHTGGANKVHLDIVENFENKQCVIIFTSKSINNHYRKGFSACGHVIELVKKIPFNIFRYIYIGMIASYINKLESGVYFGFPAKSFYDILHFIHNSNIIIADIIHSTDGLLYRCPPELYKKLTYRITINHKTYRDLKNLYKKNNLENISTRVQLIENKTDFDNTEYPERKSQILNIIYVGRGTAEKRIHLILKTARLLQKNNKIHFHLIGDLSSYEKDSLKNVTFHGLIREKSKLAELYQLSDIILITSVYEGFPLVIMEAMKFGVIPITTNVGGIYYHIKDDETGYLICSNDENQIPHDISNKILELSNNNNKLRLLQSNCYYYSKKNFHSNLFDNKYKSIFLINN